MAGSLLTSALVIASIRFKNASGKLIFLAFVLMIIRQLVRILDFENTRGNEYSE
jgi:hypothetical protein